MPTVRARVYEADPLVTFVDRLAADDELSPYHLLPEHLVEAFETADRQLTEARTAVEKYIADNRLTEHDPAWTEA
jgi:hypothetical protein